MIDKPILTDIQAQLDKQDVRIELGVAALRKQAQKAVRTAANLEVTSGVPFCASAADICVCGIAVTDACKAEFLLGNLLVCEATCNVAVQGEMLFKVSVLHRWLCNQSCGFVLDP